MWRELLVGKGLIKDDNFLVMLFLSLTGLDFSLWLVSSGLPTGYGSWQCKGRLASAGHRMSPTDLPRFVGAFSFRQRRSASRKHSTI